MQKNNRYYCIENELTAAFLMISRRWCKVSNQIWYTYYKNN